MLSLIQVAKISKLILKIEKKYKINKFKYKNVNFWPLIRFKFESNDGLNSKNYYKSNNSNATNIFKVLKNLIINFKVQFTEKKKIYQLSNYKYDAIFFSNHNFYYDYVKGKKFNSLTDPYLEILRKKKKILKVEVVNSNFSNYQKKIV